MSKRTLLLPFGVRIQAADVFLVLALFVFIYNPRLYLPVSPYFLLTLMSLGMLLTIYSRPFTEAIKQPTMQIFLGLLALTLADTALIGLLSHFDLQPSYFIISTMAAALPCALMLSIFAVRRRFSLIHFLNIVLAVGMVQVGIIIASLLMPGLRLWIIQGSGSQQVEALVERVGIFRVYGLSEGYSFELPLFQGLCVIISYVLGGRQSARYYVLIPFYLLSIAVNARVALISLFIAPLVDMVLQVRSRPFKQMTRLAAALIVVSSAAWLVQFKAVNSDRVNSWTWLYSAYLDIQNFVRGDVAPTMDDLGTRMWFAPETVDLLLGSGVNVYSQAGRRSDIGYVVYLHYGGLVYSFLLYAAYAWIILRPVGRQPLVGAMKLMFLVFLFFSNAKGSVFMPTPLTKGILLVMVFLLVQEIASRLPREKSGESGVALPAG